MKPTRRALIQTAAAFATTRAEAAAWKPKLGIYCRYSPANIAFAGQEGFNCVQIALGGGLAHEASDKQVAEVKRNTEAAKVTIVALGGAGNHFDPKFQQR